MTARKKRVTVTAIKRRFPHPMAAMRSKDEAGEYCVGGAVCKESGMKDENFPNNMTIRDAIVRLNPHDIDQNALSDMDADYLRDLAFQIVSFNDRGDFKQAWKTVGILLRWKPKYLMAVRDDKRCL